MPNVGPGAVAATRKTRPAGPSAGTFLNIARKQIGDRYTWGGSTPAQGFDCSGLVFYAAQQAGLKNVPRSSEAQWAWVQHISRKQLRPGDLVFEQWPGDQAAPGHVAIYTGSGRIEEAPQPGQSVHEVAWSPGSVAAAGGRIVGYGRIPGLSGAGAAAAAGGASGGVTTTASILSWPGQIVDAFSSAGQAIDWLLQPSHWVRIISGLMGALAVLTGVFMLSRVGG